MSQPLSALIALLVLAGVAAQPSHAQLRTDHVVDTTPDPSPDDQVRVRLIANVAFVDLHPHANEVELHCKGFGAVVNEHLDLTSYPLNASGFRDVPATEVPIDFFIRPEQAGISDQIACEVRLLADRDQVIYFGAAPPGGLNIGVTSGEPDQPYWAAGTGSVKAFNVYRVNYRVPD